MQDMKLNLTKNISNDRIIILEKIPGEATKTVTGTIDNRLFSGQNRLHALKDQESSFWKLRYDSGLLAEPLKQSWTSFGKLYSFVSEYFKRRGVEIKEVIDA